MSNSRPNREEEGRQLCADAGLDWDALTDDGRELFRLRADGLPKAAQSRPLPTQEEFWQRDEPE